MTNPYLQQTADALTASSNQNLMQTILPGINRGSVATGGYGGSRHALTQGIAAGNAQTGLDSAIANMYQSSYESDANRQAQQAMQAANLAAQQKIAEMQDATQRFGLDNQYTLGMGNLALGNKQADQSYGLGMGNLGLGYYNAGNNYNLGLGGLQNQAQANQQNFYTAQRGQDLQAQNQGYNQYLGLLGAQMGLGQQVTGIGQQQYQAGLNPLNAYASVLNPFTGLNTTQTQSQPSTGGGLGGALGGALTMEQLLRLFNGG